MPRDRDRRDALGTLVLVAVVLLAGTLIQEGDQGLGDMPAFGYVLILGFCAGLAVLMFGVVLPHARSRGANQAGWAALVLALLSALLIPGLWPGFALVLGPAAIRLGIDARQAGARWHAVAAVVVGAGSLLAAVFVFVFDWFPF